MKKTISFIAFIGLTLMAHSQQMGIRFESNQNWAKIKEKAKREHKFIFLDAFATWCGPCKFMDSIYRMEYVGKFMNERFISVKIQMDSTKNDNAEVKSWYGTAKKMMTDYKISGFPSLLFFDPNGILVHKRTGAKFDTTFVKIASMALRPATQYYTKIRSFREGKLDFGLMPALAKEAMEQQEYTESSEISSYYINNFLTKLKEEALYTKENLSFIKEHMTTETSGFRLFMNNSERINEVLGENMAEYGIRKAIADRYIPSQITWKFNRPNWVDLEDVIKAKFGALGLEVLYGKEMMYYLDHKDWTNFGKYYMLYFERALKRPEYIINNISWKLFTKVNEVKVLNFACNVVMKYAIEEWYPTFVPAYDTYANLLYKTGRVSEAIRWEQRALKAEGGGINKKIYAQTLQRMREGEVTWNLEEKK